MLLIMSSCASRLANTRRDAQQPFNRVKRDTTVALEGQVMRCLQQNEESDSGFKVTRIIKLTRIPVCGLGLLSSVWTLGLWPNYLPAPYIADVEGSVAGKSERRQYRLFLDEYHGVLLWLCPTGREDVQLARALSGSIQRNHLRDPQSPRHPKQP